MSTSKIEWTEATWNPLAGCNRVSPGCEHCYAERMAFRLEQMGQEKYKGLTRKTEGGKIQWTGKINLDERALLEPLSRKKPTMYFVNSMSDLFHPNVPFEFVDKVFAVMALTPQHTYQVLTKRPDRMAEYMNRGVERNVSWFWQTAFPIDSIVDRMIDSRLEGLPLPLPNVWLGTSVENQKTADERIPHLLQCPAKVRFLSCEPLLGSINLSGERWGNILKNPEGNYADTLLGRELIDNKDGSYSAKWIGKIHWVIAGGESGHDARPMHPDWVRGLRDQCHAAGVAFFFKQWGDWMPLVDIPESIWESVKNKPTSEVNKGFVNQYSMKKVGKKAAGNLLDGRKHEAWPG